MTGVLTIWVFKIFLSILQDYVIYVISITTLPTQDKNRYIVMRLGMHKLHPFNNLNVYENAKERYR